MEENERFLMQCLCVYKNAEFYVDFKHLDTFFNKKTQHPVEITDCSHIC